MPLNGDEFCKAFFFGKRVRLGKLPCKAVGNADIARFSSFDNAVQAVHYFFERRVPVPHMIDIQIHIVHAEIGQTGVDHILDMPLTRNTVLDLLRRARQKLGRHNDLLTLGKVAQRPADILLAAAALVGDGGIIEIHAERQAAFDDLSGVCFVDRPAVLPSLGVAKAHTSHANTGHVQVRAAELGIFHLSASSLVYNC